MQQSLLGAALAAALLATPALAQSNAAYPTKPVRIVSPFAPGGGSDLMARTLAIKLGEDLNQTFIVDNRTGGNGNIGTDIVARAPSDGYTLLLTTNATVVINPQLFTKVVTYDPVKDLSPISLVASQPFVLVVHPSVQAKSVPELIALAKAKPGTLNYASSGAGGGAHLAGEMLKTFAKVDITHVPYKGSNPGLAALAGGQVQFMFVAVLAATPLIEQNRVRALAVTTAQRNPVLPNLPAMKEFPGLEQFESDLWYGLLAPGKTSPAIVDKLYNQTKTILSRPDVKSRFEPSGTILVGNSPKQFAEVITKDIAKWGNVIKAAKVTAEYGG